MDHSLPSAKVATCHTPHQKRGNEQTNLTEASAKIGPFHTQSLLYLSLKFKYLDKWISTDKPVKFVNSLNEIMENFVLNVKRVGH